MATNPHEITITDNQIGAPTLTSIMLLGTCHDSEQKLLYEQEHHQGNSVAQQGRTALEGLQGNTGMSAQVGWSIAWIGRPEIESSL